MGAQTMELGKRPGLRREQRSIGAEQCSIAGELLWAAGDAIGMGITYEYSTRSRGHIIVTTQQPDIQFVPK